MPVGHATVEKTVGSMCKSTEMVGYYTNHSFRASSIPRLYQHEVNDQQIMERTAINIVQHNMHVNTGIIIYLLSVLQITLTLCSTYLNVYQYL